MAWTYLDSLTATTGETTVAVPGAIPFNDVLQGWALLIGDMIYELDDGLARFDDGSELYLRLPWEAATYTGPAAIVPVNNSYEALLRKFQEQVDSLAETRLMFDLLTWREANDWLQVTPDGQRIRTVSSLELATSVFTSLGIDPAAPSEGVVQGILEAVVIRRPAGGTVIAGRAVAITPDDLLVHADPTSSTLHKSIGLAYNSANIGEQVAAYTKGKVPVAGATFTTGGDIWLGVDGLLQQTVPATGYIQPLGRATAADEIVVNIGRSYYRNASS